MKTWLLILGWLAVLVVGFGGLLRHASTPAPMSPRPVHWPADSTIAVAPDQPTLLLFAHPHCPCTRASIEELARILARCHGALTARVLIWQPTSADPNWSRTENWQRAEAIPGVTVLADVGGREAARHGVTTSGQVLLYTPDGQLLFRGGITPARGHEGDNPGKQAVIALTLGETPPVTEAPVFGCSLGDDSAP